MLFGALFSTYIILRQGSVEWPHGELNVWLGMANASSDRIVGDDGDVVGELRRWATSARAGCSCCFTVSSSRHLSGQQATMSYCGSLPGAANCRRIPRSWRFAYTLTGLHGLHIVGGMVVMLYLLAPGTGLWKPKPGAVHRTHRNTPGCWHLVDLVWIFLFPILYLL